MTAALRAVLAVAGRPDLWPTAFGAARSLAPNHWWRRAPYLPLPDRRWLRFRLVTAYGGTGSLTDGNFDPGDMITWLEWRKNW